MFPAKKYGWGWGSPNCWQGWVVMGAYIVLLGGRGFLLMPKHPVLFAVNTGIFTMALIIVCFCKGEKPGWHWGGK